MALYAGYFWAGARGGIGRAVVVTATLGLLATVNLMGVRYGSWLINLFTVSKLVPLAIFVAVGVWYVDPGSFEGASFAMVGGTGEAVLLLMFAFGGYELITLPAGEARSPRRDVPVALLLTIGIVSLVFLAVQVVSVGTLPGLAGSATPIADAAANFLGPWAAGLIALGGLIAIAGANAGTMLAGPRVTYAMAARGQLPGVLAHVHRVFRTPDASILLYAALALVLALSGSFEQMAKVSAIGRLVFYLATCAAVPILRRRSAGPGDALRLPGGDLIPLLAVAAALAILAGADYVSLAAGGVAMLVGAVLYSVYGRRAVDPSEL
jgi:amino acid transporter